MTDDLKRDLADDAEMRHFVETLPQAPQAHVEAQFASRVLAAVHARRARTGLSLPAIVTLAASLVVICALVTLFRNPIVRPSYATWMQLPRTVYLAPYDPAEWYVQVTCETNAAQPLLTEPLCSREALAAFAQ